MSGYLLKFKQQYSVKIGGRRYPVVKIGNQLWMAENLDWKFDVNGSQIPVGGNVSNDPHAWYYNGSETDYGIDGTYKCGLLYNWYAVKYLDDNKATLIPDGWHVPASSEWDVLASTVGGSSTAGTKLKADDNSVISGFPSGWNGTNDYDFSVLPAGRCSGNTSDFVGTYAFFWTSTLYGDSSRARFKRFGTVAYMYSDHNPSTYGYSLRLVKSLT